MEYCVNEFQNSLKYLPQPLRYDNVMIVDAPAFVPLEELVDSFMEVGAERGLTVFKLSCYPQNSKRLPDAMNIYDYMLEHYGMLRGDLTGKPLPLIDENNEQ